MKYEVEQKFRVEGFERLEAQLAELDVPLSPVVEQVDCYFAHPIRDFRYTDEALRLRRQGSVNAITYKGPKIDATTKTRQELELPLAEGEEHFRQFVELLTALGFRKVAEVHKRRRKAFLTSGEDRVEISLDEVAGVGTYVELEIPVEEEGVPAARNKLSEVAARLGLVHNERRSYLALLLGEDG